MTGLNAEYAEYDGSPKVLSEDEIRMFGTRHDWFYSDSYRTIANIGMVRTRSFVRLQTVSRNSSVKQWQTVRSRRILLTVRC